MRKAKQTEQKEMGRIKLTDTLEITSQRAARQTNKPHTHYTEYFENSGHRKNRAKSRIYADS